MVKDSNLLVKRIEPTDDNFGVYPNELSVYDLISRGFVIVDKDCGPTSHQTTDYACSLLGCDKAGHSGTLDPKVSGVLVTGLGKATRLMEYMLKSDKVYVCLMYLHKEVSDSDLEKTFLKFTGKIKQIPPVVSAVKREERERTIYSLDILDRKDMNKYVLFKVSCQHGTYIRKLCSDIATDLGTGGQMIELRRTKAGPFTENDNSICVDRLRNLWEVLGDCERDSNVEKVLLGELRKYIRPMEDLLVDFKKVYIFDTAVDAIAHGHDLAVPGVSKLSKGIEEDEEVAVFSLKGELVAMGVCTMNGDDFMKEEHGVFVDVRKVFMDPGVYPKHVKGEK